MVLLELFQLFHGFYEISLELFLLWQLQLLDGVSYGPASLIGLQLVQKRSVKRPLDFHDFDLETDGFLLDVGELDGFDVDFRLDLLFRTVLLGVPHVERHVKPLSNELHFIRLV